MLAALLAGGAFAEVDPAPAHYHTVDAYSSTFIPNFLGVGPLIRGQLSSPLPPLLPELIAPAWSPAPHLPRGPLLHYLLRCEDITLIDCVYHFLMAAARTSSSGLSRMMIYHAINYSKNPGLHWHETVTGRPD